MLSKAQSLWSTAALCRALYKCLSADTCSDVLATTSAPPVSTTPTLHRRVALEPERCTHAAADARLLRTRRPGSDSIIIINIDHIMIIIMIIIRPLRHFASSLVTVAGTRSEARRQSSRRCGASPTARGRSPPRTAQTGSTGWAPRCSATQRARRTGCRSR